MLKDNKDIDYDEYETVIKPFYDNYQSFVERYIMPEVIAYYLANSFYRNTMCSGTFLQYFNSASDIFNITTNDYGKVKNETIKLLKIKYALEIVSEEPLCFKKIEYPM